MSERHPVRLPDLGAAAAQVRFSLWLVGPGERVFAGEQLAEVLVAGASVDVPAPRDGRLVERLVWPRDVLTPGQVLGVVEGD